MNTLADRAANVALDSQPDWQQIVSIDDQVRVHCNWRLCIDGARRGSGNAAAGLALIAYAPNGKIIPVSRGRKLLRIGTTCIRMGPGACSEHYRDVARNVRRRLIFVSCLGQAVSVCDTRIHARQRKRRKRLKCPEETTTIGTYNVGWRPKATAPTL